MICVSVFKAYTCMILTVTERYIMGLFFIQARWRTSISQLYYVWYDIEINFCSGSLHYFFRVIFLLVHVIIYLHNVATSCLHAFQSNYFWLLLYPCICMYSAAFKIIPTMKHLISLSHHYTSTIVSNIRLSLPAWYRYVLSCDKATFLPLSWGNS